MSSRWTEATLNYLPRSFRSFCHKTKAYGETATMIGKSENKYLKLTNHTNQTDQINNLVQQVMHVLHIDCTAMLAKRSRHAL